jgi:ribose 5-phosphate isomerase B
MRVYLGSDHAGFELKDHLLRWLEDRGDEPVDCGPTVYDAQDDYPPYCLLTAARTASDPGSFGVVIGGSGNGEQMAANKVPGVRAALVWSEEIASLARLHNDANVISIGARMHTPEEAARYLEVFLDTAFTDEDRHNRRIGMLADYEKSHELPPLPGEDAASAHPELLS